MVDHLKGVENVTASVLAIESFMGELERSAYTLELNLMKLRIWIIGFDAFEKSVDTIQLPLEAKIAGFCWISSYYELQLLISLGKRWTLKDRQVWTRKLIVPEGLQFSSNIVTALPGCAYNELLQIGEIFHQSLEVNIPTFMTFITPWLKFWVQPIKTTHSNHQRAYPLAVGLGEKNLFNEVKS